MGPSIVPALCELGRPGKGFTMNAKRLTRDGRAGPWVWIGMLMVGFAAVGMRLSPVEAKTIDEAEPRIPISSLPYTISQSGSYYLTGHLVRDCTCTFNGYMGISLGECCMVLHNMVCLNANGIDVSYGSMVMSNRGF